MIPMKPTPLSQLAVVSAGQGAPKDNEFSESGVPFVRAGSLVALLSGKKESELELISSETAKLRKLKTYPKGTILFAKSGMSATKDRIYVLQNPAHVVSHLATLIPKEGTCVDYLRLALKRFPPSSLIKDLAYPAIGLGEIENFEIPVPEEFHDQIRIAHLLGKVEGMIAQRKQHLQQLDDLLKSVFLEMFGDPVRNEKGWAKRRLGEAFKVKHGFAFSSEFFSDRGHFILLTPGNFFEKGGFRNRGDKQKFYVGEPPSEYVLKKDSLLVAMTEQAPGLLGSPLIVPESNLYLHNQRLGLIVEKEPVQPRFLFHLFNQKSIRQIIHSKATGTKVRHTSPTKIEDIVVGYPRNDFQQQFATIAGKVEGIKFRYQKTLADLESLYVALSQKAFKGELDLSRVDLPAAPIEGEKTVAAAVPAPITTPMFELPETDLQLSALQDRTQLEPLLRIWLDGYCTQLGSSEAFSLEHFFSAAQTRLAELHPDNDFALDANDYETIKAWVFDQIKNRKLKQTRDIIFIGGRRRFGNQILLRARRHAQQ